jgi:hypothetical protein
MCLSSLLSWGIQDGLCFSDFFMVNHQKLKHAGIWVQDSCSIAGKQTTDRAVIFGLFLFFRIDTLTSADCEGSNKAVLSNEDLRGSAKPLQFPGIFAFTQNIILLFPIINYLYQTKKHHFLLTFYEIIIATEFDIFRTAVAIFQYITCCYVALFQYFLRLLGVHFPLSCVLCTKVMRRTHIWQAVCGSICMFTYFNLVTLVTMETKATIAANVTKLSWIRQLQFWLG